MTGSHLIWFHLGTVSGATGGLSRLIVFQLYDNFYWGRRFAEAKICVLVFQVRALYRANIGHLTAILADLRGKQLSKN